MTIKELDRWLTTQPEPNYVWIELENVTRCDGCARIVGIGNLVLFRDGDDDHCWCSDECLEDWQAHEETQ